MTTLRASGSLRADLRLLRRRRFALLFAGRTVSLFGASFGPIALAFGVLALPGATPATLSVVLAGHAVPQLAFMLLGGVIGDRLPRHRVLVAAHTMSGVAFAALSVMLLTGSASLPPLTVSAVVAGAASALLRPALTSVVPEVVDAADLQPANALLRLGGNSATIAGLALAGVAVAVIGPGLALAVNAAAYLVAAGLLAGLRSATRVRFRAAPRQVLADLRVGFREFTGRQWLWTTVVSAAFLNAGSAAAFGVLGPALAREQLGGAVAWSLIMAAYTAGMLSSVVAALRYRPARPLLAAATVTPLLAGPLVALGAGVPLAVVVVVAFCAGAALNLFSVLWETTLQTQVPVGVLARVISCNYLVALSLKPVGIYLAGAAAAAFGTGPAMLALGGVMLLAGLSIVGSPDVRRLTNRSGDQDD